MLLFKGKETRSRTKKHTVPPRFLTSNANCTAAHRQVKGSSSRQRVESVYALEQSTSYASSPVLISTADARIQGEKETAIHDCCEPTGQHCPVAFDVLVVCVYADRARLTQMIYTEIERLLLIPRIASGRVGSTCLSESQITRQLEKVCASHASHTTEIEDSIRSASYKSIAYAANVKRRALRAERFRNAGDALLITTHE